MNYFLGFDGGGTKTKCVLADESLKILAESEGGPSNFLIIGSEKVARTVLNLINECLQKAKIPYTEIKAAVIGTTGAGRESDALKLKETVLNLLKSKSVTIGKFEVVSDATIALEGAFGGKAGSILIAGTGSIMFGKDEEENIFRVGGFGKLIGDEGSGNTIGKLGLNAVAKEFDGRGKATILTKMIAEQFEIKDGATLIKKVYSENFPVSEVAPLVMEAANRGDRICRQILQQQSDELILHIQAMKKKIKTSPMNLVLIGSPITKQNFYSDLLKEKISRLENVLLREAEFPPEIGAVILAKKLEQNKGKQ